MMKIHPFTIEKYDAVIALWQQNEGVGLSSADKRENIQFYLERNPNMSYVVQDGDSVVGAILCGHDGRRGFIHHLAVHPDYRRQWIGSQLVNRCLDELETVGIQKCHLLIFHKNESGIAFWQNEDWELRQDVYIMSKHTS